MKTTRLAVVVFAVAALASACGDDAMPGMQHETTTASSAAGSQNEHNDQDITFAQDMIPHHAQAIDMAKLVATRSTNQQVVDLANQVENAQDPEIKQMRAWLGEWGAPSTAPSPSHGGDHGSMPGMMSSEEMTKLESLSGAEFDRVWLGMMIRHHQGAVEMAETELAKGRSDEAKALAQRIIDTQRGEIDVMQDLITA
ncbi:DUF305 domain-containing protein [Actinokineospora sp. HUAS TT18]|uniref:DUF305 domain-containing protein n=1 Tax=Actinokineospora sp. HUAS TT18 TaxID=3447451 RepID=UPI003F51BD6B